MNNIITLLAFCTGVVAVSILYKNMPQSLNSFRILSIGFAVGSIGLFIAGASTNAPLQQLASLETVKWGVLIGSAITLIQLANYYGLKEWNISVFSTVANVIIGAVLVFIGRQIFGETISVRILLGLFISFIGILLINL